MVAAAPGAARFSPEEAVANIRRATEDAVWLKAHRDELRKQHPNMLIAVYDRRVVGVAEAVEDMRRIIRKQGIDPEKCVTEVLLTEDYIWVL